MHLVYLPFPIQFKAGNRDSVVSPLHAGILHRDSTQQQQQQPQKLYTQFFIALYERIIVCVCDYKALGNVHCALPEQRDGSGDGPVSLQKASLA